MSTDNAHLYVGGDYRNGWLDSPPRSSWFYGHRGEPLPGADVVGWCHSCETLQMFGQAIWAPYPREWNWAYALCAGCGREPWGWGVWAVNDPDAHTRWHAVRLDSIVQATCEDPSCDGING